LGEELLVLDEHTSKRLPAEHWSRDGSCLGVRMFRHALSPKLQDLPSLQLELPSSFYVEVEKGEKRETETRPLVFRILVCSTSSFWSCRKSASKNECQLTILRCCSSHGTGTALSFASRRFFAVMISSLGAY
jgi:hypothetical protein